MIHLHRDQGVLEIVLDRPLKRNALNGEMYERVARVLCDVNVDDAIAVVLIRAEGEYFCAGQDVAQLAATGPRLPMRDRPVFAFMRSVLHCERPIVAAVQGPAIGIGATMLMHFDLVYVADSAWLSFPFCSLGLSAEFGASVLLPKLVGSGTAARALLLGEKLRAQEIVGPGWAAAGGSTAATLASARTAAARLAGVPKPAVAATRGLMRHGGGNAFEEVLIRELEVFDSLRSTPEHLTALSILNRR